jgi:O-antigen ligase
MFSLLLVGVPIMLILFAGPLANELAWAYERLNSVQTAESRIIVSHAGQQMFLAKPFFGWGYGNYDRYDWQFMERVGDIAPTNWDIEEATSHNTYVTILAETGLMGLFLYSLPVFWWLRLTVKALPRLPQEGFWSWRLLVMLWLSVGFYVLVTQFMDMRFFRFSIGLVWLTLGLIANMVQAGLEAGSAAAPHRPTQAGVLKPCR